MRIPDTRQLYAIGIKEPAEAVVDGLWKFSPLWTHLKIATRLEGRLTKRRHCYDIHDRETKVRNVYTWYLGDEDKYGIYMDIKLRKHLREFGILDKIRTNR